MPDFVTTLARGLFGIAVLLGICWLLSANRRAISWRLVGAGLALQMTFAVLTFYVPPVRFAMEAVASGFVSLLAFSKEAGRFLFGPLADETNGTFGFILAFQILPTIVFFAAFTSALYYLGILQRVVHAIAWVLTRTLRLSGAESLSAAANIFVGQTEAPLLVKPFLEKMTRSELLCVMTGGMATIAGGVMAAYVGMLGGPDRASQELFALHLLTASILSAPAAVVAAKMLLPQTEEIDERIVIPRDKLGTNFLDALTIGTTDGLRLALNVGAMLIAFTALVAFGNWVVANGVGGWTGLNEWVAAWTDGRYTQFNLQFIVGLAFAPVAFVAGVPSQDLLIAGQLLGERMVLNEFVSYLNLSNARADGRVTDPTTILVMTYALCGFANIVSMGIQIGGISALAPSQRENLARLAPRSVLAGTVACLLTACVALIVHGPLRP